MLAILSRVVDSSIAGTGHERRFMLRITMYRTAGLTGSFVAKHQDYFNVERNEKP